MAGDLESPATRRSVRWAAALLWLLMACGGSEVSDTTTTVIDVPTTAQTEMAAAPFDLQGHRGARGLKPENTLPGFEVALDLAVTTLELDLHRSADGEVVVWHDPVISADKCTAGEGPDPQSASEAELRVVALEAAVLRTYRCALNPDPERFPDQDPAPTPLAGDDYGIVTLGELFEFVERYAADPAKSESQRANAATVMFNVETKRVPGDPGTIGDEFDGVTPGAFETALVAAVDEAGVGDRVVYQSFDHRSLWAIATLVPDATLAPLTRRNDRFDSAIVSRGATIWSPDHRALSEAVVAEAHDAGLLVIPWTVNEVADAERLIGWGVDGLITDRPDLITGPAS